MAYGGGAWAAQNKTLPGAYINISSKSKAQTALSERGIAAVPVELGWGPESTVQLVTAADFFSHAFELFGYKADAAELMPLRELFCHATTAYVYRLGTGAKKATCTYATAKYGGTRGNDVYIKIALNPEQTATPNGDGDESAVAKYYDVFTFLDDTLVDMQTVQSASELTDNAFVDFNRTATLSSTAKTPLTGGENAAVTGTDHQSFLNAMESYSFNTLCCPCEDGTTAKLYVAYTQRLREEIGAKFQLVVYRQPADYEGVISVENAVATSGIPASSLVYWVCGAEAGCATNESLTNTEYDGELDINAVYTQAELEQGIQSGKLMLHNANGVIRILEDINTLVTYTDNKGDVFGSNQTVRVCDQIANDITVLFNTQYIGRVPNDASGRAALWNDVIMLLTKLEKMRAIENFDSETVTVDIGNDRKSVLLNLGGITVLNAMSKLYMSIVIS